MKIDIIGSRGYPFSYASAEDMVREFGPRLVRDGHTVTVHGWADYDPSIKGKEEDVLDGIVRKFHRTRPGKISGQFIVALKASIAAARSDSDIVFYIFVNSAIFGWIPRLFGKKVFTNIDGIMWKDPKWPPLVRHVFFPAAAYFAILLGKAITDSVHMQAIYRKKFRVSIDWAGYGCQAVRPEKRPIDVTERYPDGYYLIMSRITPHNLTDIMVDGFIASGSTRPLLVAGHTPDSDWFRAMVRRAEGKNVIFLGLVRDQAYLTQLIMNARAYLHGHSLGGINPALVRVTGLDVPAIAVDTVFNREVLESPNKRLQACVFDKSSASVADAIRRFESDPDARRKDAESLGATVRTTMSWESIYRQYLGFLMELAK
ncbi:MAG: glycosyltransferase family 1 protein [Bacteroidetes bacterium]|nr:MAG: glycosyltransferase family 1 protein [Bacteroidota bacterium]